MVQSNLQSLIFRNVLKIRVVLDKQGIELNQSCWVFQVLSAAKYLLEKDENKGYFALSMRCEQLF